MTTSNLEKLYHVNQILLEERKELEAWAEQFPMEKAAQRRLLRSLMNTRHPMPLSPGFLALQDEVLSAEREEKGTVVADTLPVTATHPQIAL